MRSNKDFIEVTGKLDNKKFLINKRNIIFVTRPEDGTENDRAVVMVENGGQVMKIIARETYKDVTEELLWEPSEWEDNTRRLYNEAIGAMRNYSVEKEETTDV